MAEYIDRKKVEEAFDDADPDICESYPDGYNDWGFGRENVRDVIRGVPTADVAQVVRCKDCEWFADNNDGSWFGCWLFHTIRITPEDAPKPDDFCSYGELKMDGGGDR